MPFRLDVRVEEARDLPVMDRATELTDAYVEVRVGSIPAQKTKSFHKSLNPKWNAKFLFEVSDDATAQDDPLVLRVWDYDVLSANDIIGGVYINLHSLLSERGPQRIAGWFPIYDTLRGVRGELKVVVKLHRIVDANPFKHTSPGVQFFACNMLRNLGNVVHVIGLVDELLVEDDPEHHWADTFRTSRNSNAARQLLLHKLAGRLRRQIGRKTRELGGNAVLGYHQHFDLEGDMGLVARGYGTACVMSESGTKESRRDQESQSPTPFLVKEETSLAHSPSFHSISSSPQKSEILAGLRVPSRPPGDIPLLTLTGFEPKTIKHFGPIVLCRLVKVVDKGRAASEERDAWWLEARTEIRSHAASLACSHVVGYRETVAVQEEEEICVVSAMGTAVVINPGCDWEDRTHFCMKRRPIPVSELSPSQCGDDLSLPPVENSPEIRRHTKMSNILCRGRAVCCGQLHLPYSYPSANLPPFRSSTASTCQICHNKSVPEVLLSTTEIPSEVLVLGEGSLIEARVCRQRKKAAGETAVVFVNDGLPFLEYDMHRHLILKLKILGMNAVFGLRIDITVGENLLIGVASGTAVYAAALPPPPVLQLRDLGSSFATLQKKIQKTCRINAEKYRKLMAQFQDGDVAAPSARRKKKADGADELRTSSSSRRRRHKGQGKEREKEEKEESVEKEADREEGKKTAGGGKSEKRREREREKVDGAVEKDKIRDGFVGRDQAPEKQKRKARQDRRDKTGEDKKTWDDKDSHDNRRKGVMRSSTPGITPSLDIPRSTSSNKDHPEGNPPLSAPPQVHLSDEVLGRETEPIMSGVVGKQDLPFVVEIDEETDEEVLPILLGSRLPKGVVLCTTEEIPGFHVGNRVAQWITAIRRVRWNEMTNLNKRLHNLLEEMHLMLAMKFQEFKPCGLLSITSFTTSPSPEEVQLVLCASCFRIQENTHALSDSEDDLQFAMEQDAPSAECTSQLVAANLAAPTLLTPPPSPTTAPSPLQSGSSERLQQSQLLLQRKAKSGCVKYDAPHTVEVSPRSCLPGMEVKKYLGYVNVHLVKESFSLRDEMGMGGFTHRFITEVLAVSRAEVGAMGGNALLSCSLDLCYIRKKWDQGYCFISISGDAVVTGACV